MNKIPVNQIVIVEGRYDKITLENIIDATIIPCDGFALFKNKAFKESIKSMARSRGAIILTDSDRAGAVIRSHLNSILQNCEVYELYVPAISGKEKRKSSPSKEGLLGVEGIPSAVLYDLFKDFKAEPIKNDITPGDLYECGLSGVLGAKEAKCKLLSALELPMHLSKNALLKELNRKFDREEFFQFISKINKGCS
jgi:ribonuclease M5